MELKIEVSAGELLDKISILEIKAARIVEPGKLANVRAELAALSGAWTACSWSGPDLEDLRRRLRAVNETLWDVEDGIRRLEAAGSFGTEFVALARAVYRHNDERAAIKRSINLLVGSRLVEEKSYPSYTGGPGDGPPAGKAPVQE